MTLRSGEQRRVGKCRAERRSYLPHRFAHGVEEGGAGVFHQAPAIGDLEGAGKRLTRRERKASAAVSRDDSDLWLSGEQCLHRRRLSVRQEFDRTIAFEVANDRAIALLAFPCPVVDADDVRQWRRPSRHAIRPTGRHDSSPATRSRRRCIPHISCSSPPSEREPVTNHAIAAGTFVSLPRRSLSTATKAEWAVVEAASLALAHCRQVSVSGLVYDAAGVCDARSLK